MATTMTNALTDEEVEFIEAAIIEEQLEAVIGRNIFGVTSVDAGTLTYTYNKLTNMSDAEIVAEGAEFPYDNVSRTPTSEYIKKLGKGFQLSRESILAARKGGYDINTWNARSAVRQVAELEETQIFTELESSATTDYVANTSGGGNWAAADSTPTEDIIDVRTVLRNYNFRFTDLLIKPDFYKYLLIPNSYGITPMSEIEALGVRITETANIATGSDAIACDASQVTLVVAEDVATEGEYVLANQAFNNQVFERVVPVVYNNDALVKLDLTTSS
jgi:hypothetical protein